MIETILTCFIVVCGPLWFIAMTGYALEAHLENKHIETIIAEERKWHPEGLLLRLLRPFNKWFSTPFLVLFGFVGVILVVAHIATTTYPPAFW